MKSRVLFPSREATSPQADRHAVRLDREYAGIWHIGAKLGGGGVESEEDEICLCPGGV